jgi:CubicO group peptidase (beta-lactamase class C family)
VRIARIVMLVAFSVVSPHGILGQSAASTSAASLNSQELQSIDAFVAAEMARHRIPGLAIGVYSRGRILLAKGYGQANVELGVPGKPETIFQSGSVGKQFPTMSEMWS